MVQTARFFLALLCAGSFLLSSSLIVDASTQQQTETNQAETSQAEANQTEPEQEEGEYSLVIHVLKDSEAIVRVDDELRFSGTLDQGFYARWTGDQLYLEVESGSAVQVTLNDQYFGVYGVSAQSSVLNWPPESTEADTDTEAELTQPSIVVQRLLPRTPEPASTTLATSAPTTVSTSVPTAPPTVAASAQPSATSGSTALALSATSTPVALPAATASSTAAPVVAASPAPQDYYYTVRRGEVLSTIAAKFGISTRDLAQANEINNPSLIQEGMRLKLPNYEPSSFDQALGVESSIAAANIPNADEIVTVGADISPATAFNRLTAAAQAVTSDSPYYYTTYVTYYGRPNVPIMGILGEYSIDGLTPLLKKQAEAYDEANGPQLRVKPAFHLVYGMAARAPGRNGSYLVFLEDEVVQAYIDRAQQEGFDVILDVQIGALRPAESLALAFKWLKYPNVHLGLDPEFAMSHAGQAVPGNPIGFVTAAQVNEAQRLMQDYMRINRITGSRILLLHQFIDRMIVNKPNIDWSYTQVDLTISVDGWGGPWNKITKYNSFVNESTEFSAFKLFYRWDEPVLPEDVAVGSARYGNSGYYHMNVTPNLIIYQ